MKKIVIFSLITTSVLCLLKIFSVIPFNRMAADDYGYAYMVMQKGFWGAQKTWYMLWTGRITFLLLLFAFATFYSRWLSLKLVNFKVLLLSTVTFVFLYLLTPNKSESWYWMTGSITYLWPIILLTLGSSYFFIKKLKKIEYLLSFIFVFFAVGGNETFGLLIFLILGTFLIYSLLIKRLNKLLLITFIGSFLSFALIYFAPGNSIRSVGGGSDQMSLFGSILYSIQTGPMYFYSIIWKNIFFILPLVFCLSFFFSSDVIESSKSLTFESILKKIFIVSAVPIVASIIYMLPSFRILGRMPPDRSDITLVYIFMVALIVDAFYLGQIFNFSRVKSSVLFTTFVFLFSMTLFASSFVITSSLASDIYVAKNYSTTFDKVVMEIKSAKLSGKHGTITVTKLPPSGLIASADLKGYPGYDKNSEVAEYYGIEAVIAK
jgi:hypothetical protein